MWLHAHFMTIQHGPHFDPNHCFSLSLAALQGLVSNLNIPRQSCFFSIIMKIFTNMSVISDHSWRKPFYFLNCIFVYLTYSNTFLDKIHLAALSYTGYIVCPFTQRLCRGFGRCQQPCKPPRRSDDAPAPISEGAGIGFGEGLQLNSWSIIDSIIGGSILNSKPTVSWLFVRPSPKLLTPVTAITAEVLPQSSILKSIWSK